MRTKGLKKIKESSQGHHQYVAELSFEPRSIPKAQSPPAGQPALPRPQTLA